MWLSKRDELVTKVFRFFGYFLVVSAVFIFVRTFYPVFSSEFKYQTSKLITKKSETIPVNTDFSIVIPKINVNSKVIKNIDPNNPAEYQKALTQGVAHALGSGLPGFPGNTFIFAHSANNWYQANQFNAVFYLTDKLIPDDQIIIYYEGSKYQYTVTEKKIVKGSEISYLSNNLLTNSLTLMTCWPPGTTLNRLIVIANLN
jgi:sortase A